MPAEATANEPLADVTPWPGPATATWTGLGPAWANVCVAVTLKTPPPSAAIVPGLVVPSAHVIVALKSEPGATVAASASLNVATVPENGVPSVACGLAKWPVMPAEAIVALPLADAAPPPGPLTAIATARLP